MSTPLFPRMLLVRQRFPSAPPLDVRATVRRELAKVQGQIRPGMRVAVAVGSRGISNLAGIVGAVVETLREAGGQPFVVPAMGSHGGATPEGQIELLGEYGVTSAALGVPIHGGMDVQRLGTTPDGVEVCFSAEALRADAIVIVNRVKPHTDFSGALGSGILKMLVVGLGKRHGASIFHRASNRIGFEHVLRTASRVILRSAPVLCGVAIVENQRHETAAITVLRPDHLEAEEERLFQEARRLMPQLPFAEVDLLIVDRMGKNISGAGMDPNVVGRSVHGYSSLLKDRDSDAPAVRRLFVRELTPESHGNATGIGMADFTTTRLVEGINRQVSTVNTLTAMTPQGVKIPIYYDTDHEVLTQALDTLALADPRQARVIHIADTLSVERVAVSEAYAPSLAGRSDLELVGGPEEMRFDAAGQLQGPL